MFVDYARIEVQAGSGGNGCVAFRREKFVPRGGPSGGDGGRGGHVYLRSTSHLTTLLPFRYRPHFRAPRGRHGSGNNRHGRGGEDLTLEVPVGTQVRDARTRLLLVDFIEDGQTFLLARGGAGGRGNARFANAVNQAPRRAETGRPGEDFELILELKTLADVGLVGLPNAGKSTLISAISAARPAIGNYPFTTLTPHLGVVSWNDFRSYVVADIPGLIAGAHQGAGLGDRFLRHLERTRVLAHLVDVGPLGPPDPVVAFETIENEISSYDADLSRKPRIVVATKLDCAQSDKLDQLREYCECNGYRFLAVSSASGTGLEQLRQLLGESTVLASQPQ